MGLPRSNDGEARFSAYVEGLTSVIGHADRAKPLRDYCLGLMMPCERKSVEPMAAITAPERTAAQHQSRHAISEQTGGPDWSGPYCRYGRWISCNGSDGRNVSRGVVERERWSRPAHL